MDENDVLAYYDGPAEEADVREVPEDNTEHEMRGEHGSGGHVRGGGGCGRREGGEHGMLGVEEDMELELKEEEVKVQ